MPYHGQWPVRVDARLSEEPEKWVQSACVLPLLTKTNLHNFLNLLWLWAIVLVANLAGALAFAWTVANLDVFEPPVRQAFTATGLDALAGDFWSLLVRGVFAGWLIALLVWLLPFAESAGLRHSGYHLPCRAGQLRSHYS